MKRFALQLFALLLTISVSAQDNMTIGKRLYEQAEGKRWSKTKNGCEKIIIVRHMPFAPFIFVGTTIYLVMKVIL